MNVTDIAIRRNCTIHPFLKWAGGKRWLTSAHSDIFPTSFLRYIEPFLGSGAVFFSLHPQEATLADINTDLIDCYTAVRDNWITVQELLTEHHNKHTKEYYYKIRQVKPTGSAARAARFIYLNRTCWNALYRVNLKGEFNVPIGTKSNVVLDTDNFEEVSRLLQRATIARLDFEKVIDGAGKDDLIFADPPYTVKHNFNGFVKYNEKMFHWDDQVRLSKCLIRASKRGCKIVLTNANHPSIKELYENDFSLTAVTRSSVIAASSSRRGVYEELIIRNFDQEASQLISRENPNAVEGLLITT
jgi:DNA adenine methylase